MNTDPVMSTNLCILPIWRLGETLLHSRLPPMDSWKNWKTKYFKVTDSHISSNTGLSVAEPQIKTVMMEVQQQEIPVLQYYCFLVRFNSVKDACVRFKAFIHKIHFFFVLIIGTKQNIFTQN